jgi:predicted Zn finger-like uncharacterized protein
MRLICPNCDAQYEVEASLIPTSGRDVQCSNCGKTWFQEPRDTLKLTTKQGVPEHEEAPAVQEPVAEEVREGLSGDGLTREAEDFFSAEPEAEAEFGTYDEESPDAEAASDFDVDRDLIDEAEPEDHFEEVAARHSDPFDDAPDPGSEAFEDNDADEFDTPENELTTDRPEIDSAVMGILKSEADREIAARRAETEQVEVQPDLGMNDPGDTDTVADRTARLRSFDDEVEDFREEPRRALLPDIDEINSTLTATSDRTAEGDAAVAARSHVEAATAKRRVGFRLGFSMMLIIAAALILVYLFAPQIAEAVPTTEPQLASYVDWANGMRQTIDTYLKDSVNRLTTLLVELTT